MPSKEDNAFLTRTGPGTPMGDLLRRYWIPALLSTELPEPDCRPIRAKLLGEALVAFRDTIGRVGLLGANCPHRGASLFFGRNEESGLRCVYHGWKFDTQGTCVDMPNEPPLGTRHAVPLLDKIHHKAYPCEERGGLVWAYMGPRDAQPPLPELEWAIVPADRCAVSKRLQECNWLQAMEGGIDSSHISFLHRDPGVRRVLGGRGQQIVASDTAPRFEVAETDYGLLIGARRNADDDHYYWRITQWLMPWYTMIPPFGSGPIGGHAWVPADDENCWAYSVSWHPGRLFTKEERAFVETGGGIHAPLIPGTFRPVANRDNDYLIDRELQRRRASFTGIKGIAMQDMAVQESMGAIYDRSQEHLGTTDMAIIAARRRLMRAAVALQDQGIDPPGLDPASQRVRSTSVILPRDVAWPEGAREGLIARPGVYAGAV